MTLHRPGRWALVIAAVILIAVIATAAFALQNLLAGKIGGPVQVANASADAVTRGKYLAAAADCAACHTAPGGAPFAGGLPMQSGFGTIYATNITPDPDVGIGRWSAEDFWHALHSGVRRDGRQLYPAMPYTSYRDMTRADSDAIYAYVMQLRPMKVAGPKTELRFPFNLRLGMVGWNLLFLSDKLPAVSTGRSPAWQRGRYLVNVLGHCGECHTPRGIAGEMKLSQSLTGFALGRVAAPDITPAALAARGWTAAGLRAFLMRGTAQQSWAFADMRTVVALSTRNMTAEDLDAVTTYLLGDDPLPVRPPAIDPAQVRAAATGAGRLSYVALCAGCHGLDGNGVPNTVVAIRNNSTPRLADPRNLIVAMLDGVGRNNFPHSESMEAMPGFSDKLSDSEAAELANYLRVTFGGQKGDVTAADVRALRALSP
ncbi:cytochrome c [Bradyrhizobium sp. Arg816]|uniref:c-type cytochrome n=1 Tax=Bradyrhizobium sp. Arg816 TaxID=2998491 RepID=UPI00249F55C9|nr:cytochrome c [Bradyrhizobium sp. Arg816]MDI3566066.1 cytochrome c [Bradyrhizobium sp. Arg816]